MSVLVVVILAALLIGTTKGDQEHDQHPFQTPPNSLRASNQDAQVIDALRNILLRSMRSPARIHGGRRYDYVKRFPEVNARGFESDIFDEGFGDFSPVRRR